MSDYYKLPEWHNDTTPDSGPKLKFLFCERFYKIRFDNTLIGAKGKNCELNIKYKSLEAAEQAARVICQGKAYKNVRIALICEYSADIKRIK